MKHQGTTITSLLVFLLPLTVAIPLIKLWENPKQRIGVHIGYPTTATITDAETLNKALTLATLQDPSGIAKSQSFTNEQMLLWMAEDDPVKADSLTKTLKSLTDAGGTWNPKVGLYGAFLYPNGKPPSKNQSVPGIIIPSGKIDRTQTETTLNLFAHRLQKAELPEPKDTLTVLTQSVTHGWLTANQALELLGLAEGYNITKRNRLFFSKETADKYSQWLQ